MAYKVPALDKDLSKNSSDVYALEVMAGVLSNTSAARLNQSLVNEQSLAIGAGAGYTMITRGGLSLVEFYANPSEGVSTNIVEEAIKKEIKKIAEHGVTQDELNRIKTSVIANAVYEKDSVFYQAMLIGQLETMGYPYTLMDQYIENVKKVTSDQIQEVAKKYFLDDRLTVVSLNPQPLDPNKKPQGRPHVH